jgi:formylmethanofuran dehydrogenase subunit A
MKTTTQMTQEHRIWLHSNTLGYGKWISTLEIVKILKKKVNSNL